MPWAPCWFNWSLWVIEAANVADISSSHGDKHSLDCWGEGFQLPVPYQCWEIIGNANIFPCFLETIQYFSSRKIDLSILYSIELDPAIVESLTMCGGDSGVIKKSLMVDEPHWLPLTQNKLPRFYLARKFPITEEVCRFMEIASYVVWKQYFVVNNSIAIAPCATDMQWYIFSNKRTIARNSTMCDTNICECIKNCNKYMWQILV